MNKILDWKLYSDTARQTAAEGIVMLRNNSSVLPLKKEETVAVFGRIQLHYYKSGTGSGGMVNVPGVKTIPEALVDAGAVIDEELLGIYKKWDSENPYDLGGGWGGEPWSQAEMPLDETAAEGAARRCSTAIVIIGRTAGEEMDAREEPGSFLLTDTEKDMLTKVRKAFEKVVVLLNIGGLVDLDFIEDIKPDSLLIVWQGGITGADAAADILTGRQTPSGKLPDTIAYRISDYPSDSNFGSEIKDIYKEDIYVGYRWFETFRPERVRYPFGYGLSYTTFSVYVAKSQERGGILDIDVRVTNTGIYSGKETVQLYVQKPQGALGQPIRQLCGFEKTELLSPGESEIIELHADLNELASYDDSGASGRRFCWVLEPGEYVFCVGTDVRSAQPKYTVTIPELIVVRECEQALAPNEPFRRIRPIQAGDGLLVGEEETPLNEVDELQRRMEYLPPELPYTGDKGIRLADVLSGSSTMEDFISQLSDYDLSCIIRGEGMGSPRVTAGTAAAYGGVTDSLAAFGIPAACCDDGPSGMRLDCGERAFSITNGTMIASTFNKKLTEKLFSLLGLEMSANRVDSLLGPGMNLHRHPLNGRNFEYFSEDPYLSGMMAAAELKGLHSSGVTGTIKHFCGNNQEKRRHFLDTVVSERALREIYLRSFEIPVKLGKADNIMTTYGKVNGLYTAGNYDLNTTILRRDWGYTGLTMTDWWANISRRGQEADRSDLAAMAAAQNDVYMVCASGEADDGNIAEALESGDLKRCELQRNAANICRFVMNTNAMRRLLGEKTEAEIINIPEEFRNTASPAEHFTLTDELVIDLSGVDTKNTTRHSFVLIVGKQGWYDAELTASVSGSNSSVQIPVTLYAMGTASGTLYWGNADREPVTHKRRLPVFSHYTAFRLEYPADSIELHSISFRLAQEVEDINIAFENANNAEQEE